MWVLLATVLLLILVMGWRELKRTRPCEPLPSWVPEAVAPRRQSQP